ncbi:PHP domain-containing protein [Methanolobus sp. WCC5]|uniref:PHP domain-containing protein n=1 Tax=Methanolobus sp. WCC5 TaxID=3125785 RepID=UPI0032481207
MPNISDFHTHTCYSDGDLLPEEVVRLAKLRGLQVLSITDHDTVDGLESAGNECERQEIELIPGIEFTSETEFPGIEIHILGYGIDPRNYSLLKMTERAKSNANDYCRKVCPALESFGWEIDYSIIDTSKGIITKHDITGAVINKPGSNYEFHNHWLSGNSPLEEVMQKLPARKVIKTIHRAGGKAVCAHILRTLEQTDDILLLHHISESLIRSGLDGFEVFYAKSSKDHVCMMYEICKKKQLIMTGGSDFHGPERFARCQLGEYNTYSMFNYQDLIEQLRRSSDHQRQATMT